VIVALTSPGSRMCRTGSLRRDHLNFPETILAANN